jgi:hypothetical protein
MVSDTLLQHVLWWLCPALQLAIAIAMLRRGLVKQLPLFFVYVASHLCQFVVAYVAYRLSYAAYYYVYWGWLPFDAITTLLVIEELFRTVFAPYQAIRQLGVAIFRIATLALCGIAIYSAYVAPGGNEVSHIVAGLIVADRSASVVEGGLLIVLFVSCALLGLEWKSYQFGIASGMGVLVAMGVIDTCLRSHLGKATDSWFWLAQALAFNVGMAVWLYYFVSVRTALHVNSEVGSERVYEWNYALEGILRGNSTGVNR